MYIIIELVLLGILISEMIIVENWVFGVSRYSVPPPLPCLATPPSPPPPVYLLVPTFYVCFAFCVYSSPPPLQPIFPLNFQCFSPFTHFTFSFSETPSPGKLEMLVLNLIFRLLFCIGASKFNNFIRLKWILSRRLSRLISRSRLNNSPRPYWCGWIKT